MKTLNVEINGIDTEQFVLFGELPKSVANDNGWSYGDYEVNRIGCDFEDFEDYADAQPEVAAAILEANLDTGKITAIIERVADGFHKFSA